MLKKVLLLLLLVILGFSGKAIYKKRHQIVLWWTLQTSPQQWTKDQIEQDFSDVQSISKEALNETFRKVAPYSSFRYRVVNGEIYRTPIADPNTRAAVFDKIMVRLNKAKQLPDLDFLLCTMDGVPEEYVPQDFWITEKQAPLFAWAKKNKATPFVIPIPDFLTTRESYWHKEIDIINEKYTSIPWGKREERAFWRGNSNVFDLIPSTYQEKPRFLISFLSSKNREMIDAGFSGIHQQEMKQLFEKMGIILGYAPIAAHLDYKYLPVVDGYMCTFPGFQWRLLSGSLTFKQESDNKQYFYSALKPYVHFIPIKKDMSDLLEKIAWAKSHDAECRQIANNARAFALKNLMPEQIYAYLHRVLQKYASLQSFKPEKPIGSEWKKI